MTKNGDQKEGMGTFTEVGGWRRECGFVKAQQWK